MYKYNKIEICKLIIDITLDKYVYNRTKSTRISSDSRSTYIFWSKSLTKNISLYVCEISNKFIYRTKFVSNHFYDNYYD